MENLCQIMVIYYVEAKMVHWEQGKRGEDNVVTLGGLWSTMN